MLKNITFLIFICVFASACNVYHVSSKGLTDDYYESKKSPKEILYLKEIMQPHTVIATVTVNAERNQDLDAILSKMKREAAILGGDAITNIKTDASGQWKRLPAQPIIGKAYLRANFTASVVVFQ